LFLFLCFLEKLKYFLGVNMILNNLNNAYTNTMSDFDAVIACLTERLARDDWDVGCVGGVCAPLLPPPCKMLSSVVFGDDVPLSVISEATRCHVAEPVEEEAEEIVGMDKQEFEDAKLTIWVMLGEPVVLKNDTAYWGCRLGWKKLMRKRSLSEWKGDDGETSSGGAGRRRLSFNREIGVKLIAPKEGEDFDIDDVDCGGHNNLADPLLEEEDYSEYWVSSPFPQDDGALRPFYHTTKMRSEGWCRCKTPPMQKPGRAISCRKCLNMELRKFARKSTPEEFHTQYLKNVGFE
jgi:hypothetical protein